ncbi:RNA polymerase sigma factor [Ruegeria faecimaris]|uniref:RNA polymerase sigma-70 factor, ECF subfamily n=1 Tax=Ruegeria faecimaris TaxID=686389 RepID=A0A521BSP5_9RHOB|nr:RNA polymerase sigma factor [Ruegeria faecimaris]SMO50186.1 RNA polymerase sigma-70 factor, ECF subfamily [Ruegeria faecimaris]
MRDLSTSSTGARSQSQAAGDPGDDALLRRFAEGDADAARILTDRLGPRSFSVALRLLNDRAEAEDVTQEAMMRLWKMAPDWVAGQAKVSTWLYRVALNLCVDIRRKKSADSLSDVAEPESDAISATEHLQDAARLDALQFALAQLPDRQRQAVVLRHIEELPNPEIAGIMDISVEAVESLTARGKRALAQQLAARRDELGYADG